MQESGLEGVSGNLTWCSADLKKKDKKKGMLQSS